MEYNIPNINNIKNRIQRFGYLTDDNFNDDSFIDLKCKYVVRFDKTYLVTLEMKNTEWKIELINSYEHETYEIQVSQITNDIIRSVRNTDERYGMSCPYDSDEILLMIEEHFENANEKRMYSDKMVNSFKIALDRIIPEVLINGYMNARFQMSYSNMTPEENIVFQKETDEYRNIRNRWELKGLYRKVEYLRDHKSLLQFIPDEKTLAAMGYDNFNKLRNELYESDYFKVKNQKLQNVLKHRICLFVENGHIYLKTESVSQLASFNATPAQGSLYRE